MGPMAARKRRSVILAVVGVVVLVVLAAVLGPYVYIHFIEGPLSGQPRAAQVVRDDHHVQGIRHLVLVLVLVD